MSSRPGGGKEGAPPTGVVRVLVCGDPGVGKSSLVHLIAAGQPNSSPRRTVGCNVSVKYLEYSSAAMGLTRSDRRDERRSFFVELWDVSGNPQYIDSRPIFYQQINGVIGVHDLSQRRTRTNLQKWMSEVASLGSFSAPSHNLPNEGNLPVPLLVVGNKADVAKWDPLKNAWGSGGNLAAYDKAGTAVKKAQQWLSETVEKVFGKSKAGQWVAKVGDLMHKGSYGELPRADSLTPSAGLIASSKQNQLDMDSINGFFYELIRRRYYSADMSRSPSSPSFSLVPPAVLPSSSSSSILSGQGYLVRPEGDNNSVFNRITHQPVTTSGSATVLL